MEGTQKSKKFNFVMPKPIPKWKPEKPTSVESGQGGLIHEDVSSVDVEILQSNPLIVRALPFGKENVETQLAAEEVAQTLDAGCTQAAEVCSHAAQTLDPGNATSSGLTASEKAVIPVDVMETFGSQLDTGKEISDVVSAGTDKPLIVVAENELQGDPVTRLSGNQFGLLSDTVNQVDINDSSNDSFDEEREAILANTSVGSTAPELMHYALDEKNFARKRGKEVEEADTEGRWSEGEMEDPQLDEMSQGFVTVKQSKNGFSSRVLKNKMQVMHLEISHLNLFNKFYLSAVYAKSTKIGRRQLWDDLHSFYQAHQGEIWMAGGDFNVIRSLDEYSGFSVQDRVEACVGSSKLTVKIYHGGGFVRRNGILLYIQGQVDYFDHVESGSISIEEVEFFIERLGYCGPHKIYFRDLSVKEHSGMRRLVGDEDLENGLINFAVDSVRASGWSTLQKPTEFVPYELDDGVIDDSEDDCGSCSDGGEYVIPRKPKKMGRPKRKNTETENVNQNATVDIQPQRRGRKPNQNSFCKFCKKTCHYASICQDLLKRKQLAEERAALRPWECTYCHKPGHKEDSCPILAQDEDELKIWLKKTRRKILILQKPEKGLPITQRRTKLPKPEKGLKKNLDKNQTAENRQSAEKNKGKKPAAQTEGRAEKIKGKKPATEGRVVKNKEKNQPDEAILKKLRKPIDSDASGSDQKTKMENAENVNAKRNHNDGSEIGSNSENKREIQRGLRPNVGINFWYDLCRYGNHTTESCVVLKAKGQMRCCKPNEMPLNHLGTLMMMITCRRNDHNDDNCRILDTQCSYCKKFARTPVDCPELELDNLIVVKKKASSQNIQAKRNILAAEQEQPSSENILAKEPILQQPNTNPPSHPISKAKRNVK
ncbi:OLC1v1024553C1 [Oldenlandia corymbosa var. corymbosa]|uniref:OLC1v1024553C1 n=1 Tax=Oldenlandia corymbosa var. corymbosa TaxID=529605 RepID=A0AAV1C3I6_OLDCO|nr:OLC1v1024553C1 [Oldenlandia corymbosa var. corymbosa]